MNDLFYEYINHLKYEDSLLNPYGFKDVFNKDGTTKILPSETTAKPVGGGGHLASASSASSASSSSSDKIVITMENRNERLAEINNNINNNRPEPHNNKYLRIVKIPDDICFNIKRQIRFNEDYSKMDREGIQTGRTENSQLFDYLKKNIFDDKLKIIDQNIRLIDIVDFRSRYTTTERYHRDMHDQMSISLSNNPYRPRELGSHQCLLYLDIFHRDGPEMVYYNPLTERAVEFNIPIEENEMLIFQDCYFLHKTSKISYPDFRTLIYRVSCIPENEKWESCPIQLLDFLVPDEKRKIEYNTKLVREHYSQYEHGYRYGLKYLKYKNKYLELKKLNGI